VKKEKTSGVQAASYKGNPKKDKFPEDYKLGDRYKAYKAGDKKMKYKANDEGDMEEISDEEAEILYYIDDILEENGEASLKEISEEEGNADEHTMETLQSLAEKGLIEIDEDGNVTEITSSGQEVMNEYNENKDGGMEGNPHDDDNDGDDDDDDDEKDNNNNDNDDDNDDYNDDNNDDDDDDKNDKMDMNNNNNNDDDDNGDNNDDDDDDDDEGNNKKEDNNNAGGDVEIDEDKLKMHAKNTPDDKLEEYVNDKENPEEYRDVAKEELEDRENGKGEEEEEEKAKYDEFVDNFLDDHDIEDLQEYTKGLIKEIPGEIKTLKEHYRNEYGSKHKGNSVDGKIDADDFDEYVDEYLATKPLKHLKEYTKALLAKNPGAYKKMKTNYEEIKGLK